MNVHAIVGGGSAPEKVIIEGLRDVLNEGDSVGLIWRGKPTSTEEDIFGYVLDNEIPFTMYYEDGEPPHKSFREVDHGVCQKTRTLMTSALKAVEGTGKVLFLWDDEDTDDQIDFVFDNISKDTLVLELTNGCAPIVINDDIPEPVDPDLQEEVEEALDDTTFTKEELESMTAVAVKRYGERKKTEAVTKKGIIEELFPDGETEEEEIPTPQEEPVEAPVETNTGSTKSVDVSEVPGLLRIISGNLLRLANALDS